MERRYRPTSLTDPEERIVTELSVTGARRLEPALRRAHLGDPGRARRRATSRRSLDVALARPPRPRPRERRKTAAEAVTEALEPGLRTRAYVFNTLLQDKAITDRLRTYPHWLATRNLSNEASDESVAGAGRGGQGPLRAGAPLVPDQGEAARHRASSPTTTGWPSVGADDEEIDWEEGREIVLDSFGSFSGHGRRDRRAASSPSAGSTPRRDPASAAAPSAPRPCPRSTPT